MTEEKLDASLHMANLKETAIRVENLGKCYHIYETPRDRLKQVFFGGRKKYYREFHALSDISFEIGRGETVGIIGRNGSGKSTFLQIVSGTLSPSSGRVVVNGKISALLELGAGFNPEFTGRENVMMLGAIMGLSPGEMSKKLPNIESFAEIGEFIDRPVKTYSSGMFVRLAFAAAVHVDPDILIVDEALAVGDIAFQHKCMTRMREFMERGTVLFVSHDLSSITSLCSRVIWLENGRIREIGDPKTVTEHYWEQMYEGINRNAKIDAVLSKKNMNLAAVTIGDLFNLDHEKLESFGNGSATITGIAIYDEEGGAIIEANGGDRLNVQVTVRANSSVSHPIIGLSFKDLKGNIVAGTNTDFEHAALSPMKAGEVRSVLFSLKLPELAQGSYSFSPAIADGMQLSHTMLHWVNNAALLNIKNARPVMGMLRLEAEVKSNQPRTA